ncbi:hypothetical protein EDD85DRAFT_117290 [Armillaria nabsnona]|nr:hypothetical protein EDD85DRAFT_117290 [Armillaria nabsnona]
MDTTNSAQNGFCSPIDSLTFVPGQSNIPDAENQNAFHDVAGSVPQLEFTDVASRIQTPQPSSVSTPVTEAMDAADGLIKPCPNRHRIVRVQDWAVNLGLSPDLCFYYLRDCLPNAQYHCSVDRCTDTFTETEIGNHLKAKHYGIARNPQGVTCKKCERTVRAKSYHDHFLQIHSGRSICCAYCTKRQVRVQNFRRHFKTCSGLKKYRKDQKALRPTYDFKSYLPPSSSPHPNPYPSDVQEWSTSNDGRRDDTSFSSSTPCELDDAMGTEKPSVRAKDPMEATNWAHDLYSRTNHILDGDNANASHTHLGSISPPDDASALAFRTISSW